MSSLLGIFYNRIKGSQEDIASEGLCYLLNGSQKANDALLGIIRNEIGDVTLKGITFQTQVTGTEDDRPDIVGHDESATERIMIEAKFWASLTKNQPCTYLERLAANGPRNALVFVCPALRVRSIWDELKRRVVTEGFEITSDDEKHRITYKNVVLFIRTWDQVLNAVRDVLVQDNSPLVSDVDQIIGFCRIIDETTFKPITSDDMSPSLGKRIYSYYGLIDNLVDELKEHFPLNLDGLKATPQRGGYSRGFVIGKWALVLELNLKNFFEVAETPFWITVREKAESWIVTDELREKMRFYEVKSSRKVYYLKGIPWIPLFPALEKQEDVLIADMCGQIGEVVNTLGI
ncbi:MAG: hypothetical protein JNM27_18490 [Leptospirales bacterium]|nr:hypothetical protein [Leptospirales bacterium]